MPHIPHTTIHRFVGDPLLIVEPICDLAAADVTQATWRALGAATVTKTHPGEMAVIDGATAKALYPDLDLVGKDGKPIPDAEAVLVVDLDPADTTAVGVGRWHWQATAGGVTAPVVAAGWLTLTRRILAPA